MNSSRRKILLGAIAAVLLKPWAALAAWNKEAFGAKSSAHALKGIGAADAAPSGELAIEAPEIAENGAVVPIEITRRRPCTSSHAGLLDQNPSPLVGSVDCRQRPT